MNVRLRGAGLWMPGYPDVSSWVEGRRVADTDRPHAASLPARTRRRASLLTRMCAEVLDEAATQGGIAVAQARLVLASVWGEIGTTAELLRQIASGERMVSPTLFHGSVHNTPLGVATIASKNRHGTSTLSAGNNTVAMGLIESVCTIEDGANDVILVVADEAVPEPFIVPHEQSSMAVALYFSRERGEGLDIPCTIVHGDHVPAGSWRELVESSIAASIGAGSSGQRTSRGLQPAALALPVLRGFLTGSRAVVPLCVGTPSEWWILIDPEESP